jgi:transcription elongation factor GreA
MTQKYLTKIGYEKLEQELEDCKLNKRKKIAQAIKEAKEQGDLSENAEYTEAKRQQRENESRIMKLENIIRTAEIITDDVSTDKVQIGCVIDIESKGVKNTFHIVGANEADPAQGFISNESPIGEGLLGKKKNEEVEIILPNGRNVKYKIVSIKR